MNIIFRFNVIFEYFFIAAFSILFLTARDSFAQVTNEPPQNLSINLINTTGPDSTKQINAAYIQDGTITPSPGSLIRIEPIDLKIEINEGDEYSKSKQVKLNLFAPRAKDIIISNFENLSNGKWEQFLLTKDWNLNEGSEVQTVYCRVRYPDSSMSEIFYDEIILDTIPPVAKFTVTPGKGIAGETLFSFNSGNSSDNYNLQFRWDWEDDGNYDTEWNPSKEYLHRFDTGGGKKTVRLQVRDGAGWEDTSTNEIIVLSYPQANFSYEADPKRPLNIRLDASLSFDKEDGNKLLYRWDFDNNSKWDSNWSSEKIVTHKFSAFQEKQITLQVKDSHEMTGKITLIVVNEYNDMVYVPKGNFIMGNGDWDIDERPVREIFVDDFWIDKYPVTNQQYVSFLNSFLEFRPDKEMEINSFINLDNKAVKIYFFEEQYFVVDSFGEHPVVHVTWYGANEYCKFYDSRLPTEAEWEKAARGIDGRLYPWCDEIDSSRANYWDSRDPFADGTTPVGFYNGQNYKGFQTSDSQGPFGAYDLVGNVKEWISDWYQRDYYSKSTKINPVGPKTGFKKVVRGGGFLFHADDLRTTLRYALEPNKSSHYIGFRCAKSTVLD